MLRKLLICPWFGEYPEWFGLWVENVRRLEQFGYDTLMVGQEFVFAERVKRVLGIEYPRGDGYKVCDYRCAFGLLFEEELKGYDYWGHTDLDMVYGRVGEFLPDFVLVGLDIFSNHDTYVSGPWSLYRNTSHANDLFLGVEDWEGYLTNPATTGWVETAFSRHVDEQHEQGNIVRRYESWQTRNLDNFDRCRWDGDKLLEGNREIMVAHFRRTKVYPPQLVR